MRNLDFLKKILYTPIKNKETKDYIFHMISCFYSSPAYLQGKRFSVNAWKLLYQYNLYQCFFFFTYMHIYDKVYFVN